MRPSRRRSLVAWLRRAYQVSERRVCGATGCARSSHRYRSTADPQDELRLRLKELAAARVRYGYRRLHVLLRREGWAINAKRVSRLYNEEGLSIRPKTPRRRRSTRYRSGRSAIERANDCWAMDFLADSLCDGRSFPHFRLGPKLGGRSTATSGIVRRITKVSTTTCKIDFWRSWKRQEMSMVLTPYRKSKSLTAIISHTLAHAPHCSPTR